MSPPATAEISAVGEPVEAESDAQLLLRFVGHRDEDAFHDLVSRHGQLVMGVCLRVLNQRQDAEDAFQATFIVLARRAGRIKKRDSLAAWLYGVAYRVSVDLARKRQRSEQSLVSEPMQMDDPFTKLEHEFDRHAVDEELQRLPERYRIPLVLFYMGGKTSKQIAEELGRSQGTIDGQLKRGRQQLRVRLTRRGVAMAGLLSLVAVSAEQATAAVSPSLISSTASLAVAGAAGTPIPDAVSPEPSLLAARELLRMSLIKPLTVTVFAGVALVVGTVCVNAFEGPNVQALAALNTVAPGETSSVPTVVMQAASAAQENAASPAARGPNVVGSNASYNTSPEPGTIAAATRQAHAKIEEALAAKIEPINGDQTLRDLFDFIAETRDLQIVFDRTVLEEASYPDLSEINVHEDLSLQNIRLGNALAIVFTQLDLTDTDSPLDYILDNEVLKITTRDQADAHRETRVYDVMDLLATQIAPDNLEDMVREMTSFLMVGEEDTTSIRIVNDQLVVRHNQRVHREIADLLTQLK